MPVTITADKELEKTKKEALIQSRPLLTQATALLVVDEPSYIAADDLRSKIKASRKVFWDRITKAVTPAYQALQELYSIRNDLTKPLDDADVVITDKMKAFKRIEAERVREEERRRELEAAKLREQAAEKLRREETAKTTQMQAKLAMQREALEEKAEEVETRPIETVKAANSGTRSVLKIRVLDRLALIKAVAAGEFPDDVLDVDMSVLNSYLRTKQVDAESAKAIGCEVYEDVQIVSGRRS